MLYLMSDHQIDYMLNLHIQEVLFVCETLRLFKKKQKIRKVKTAKLTKHGHGTGEHIRT